MLIVLILILVSENFCEQQHIWVSLQTDDAKCLAKRISETWILSMCNYFTRKKTPEIAVELFCAGSSPKGESSVRLFHMDKRLVLKWAFPVCLNLFVMTNIRNQTEF